jgi:hypothetical protein
VKLDKLKLRCNVLISKSKLLNVENLSKIFGILTPFYIIDHNVQLTACCYIGIQCSFMYVID